MFRTLITWIVVIALVSSAPLQAGVVQVKIDDERTSFGRIESWTGEGSLTPSLLSVFTAPNGAQVVMRVQQGFLQVTLPDSSFSLSTDGSIAHLSRSVGGATSVEVMSEAQIALERARIDSAIETEALASADISTADKEVIDQLNAFLDNGPGTNMQMSGQCWAELAALYALTIATVASCVITGGITCFIGGAGVFLGWSSFQRDCGPDANYGLPRHVPSSRP